MSFSQRIAGQIVRWTLWTCLAAPLAAQLGVTKPPAQAPSPPASGDVTASPPAHPLSAKEAHDAQIAADTEKLYQLAQELKVELDKSTKDTLSLTVVRKATEIERLAHSIGERMKSN